MTFGQLIEYEMRNIFAETLYRKCAGEKIRRDPYLKYQN